MLDIVAALWVTMARQHIVDTILVFRGVLFSIIHDLIQSYFPVIFPIVFPVPRYSCALRFLYIFMNVYVKKPLKLSPRNKQVNVVT